jgi:hypothetical protein
MTILNNPDHTLNTSNLEEYLKEQLNPSEFTAFMRNEGCSRTIAPIIENYMYDAVELLPEDLHIRSKFQGQVGEYNDRKQIWSPTFYGI